MKHKNTLAKLKVCNCKDIRLSNESIKSLSIREELPKETHITYLNTFVDLINFSNVIFHLFSRVVQDLSHATDCIGHNIYAFGIIMYCLVPFPNRLNFLVNSSNDTTSIGIPFCRTLARFWNVNRQSIFLVKTCNDFILSFAKGLHWNLCFCKNGNNFVVEGIMGWILVVTRQFIPNNYNKCIMKS